MKKVAIIGAGISGLFIANLFKKNPNYQITLLKVIKSIFRPYTLILPYCNRVVMTLRLLDICIA